MWSSRTSLPACCSSSGSISTSCGLGTHVSSRSRSRSSAAKSRPVPSRRRRACHRGRRREQLPGDDTRRRRETGEPPGPARRHGDRYERLRRIVSALYDRERSGVGCHLDISMVRTLLSLNALGLTNAQIPGPQRGPAEFAGGYGIFPSKDGFVVIGVNSDGLFRGRVGDGNARARRGRAVPVVRGSGSTRPEVNEIVAAWTSQFDSDTLIELAATAEVPCGRVSTPEDLLDDAEFRAHGFLEAVDDGLGGTIDTAAQPDGLPPRDQLHPADRRRPRSWRSSVSATTSSTSCRSWGVGTARATVVKAAAPGSVGGFTWI